VTALAARRRHPLATVLLVLLGLVITGAAYAAVLPSQADAAQTVTEDVAAGRKLFLANCSTCHGKGAEGRRDAPSLVGVGAAAVDFQVGTGRMPMAQSGPQAPQNPVRLDEKQISQLAAYVASLGPGPAVPDAAAVDPEQGDASRGSLIFRTNCAMCHGAAGKGGALTRGKYAPSLTGSTPTHIYEALVTGPQSMPVFNDKTIDPQAKRDMIAFLDTVNKTPNPGGLSLGRIGPVSEGLVAWLFGLGLLLGFAVWLGAKSS
jgi:ubiquinol-cytochrome c reductase cytochrome c subunit